MTRATADVRLIADLSRLGEAGPDEIDRAGARVRSRIGAVSEEGAPYPRALIEALCELEASDHPAERMAGRALIFAHVVEPLCDAFDPSLADLCDAIFSQIIDFQRHLPGGHRIHEALQRFGLATEDDVRNRRLRLRHAGTRPVKNVRIRRIVVLSRVTVGADIAVTSVIIRTLRARFPEAGVLMVAPPRVQQLFAGESGIEFVSAAYPRRGSLAERLSTWPEMLDSIADHTGPVPGDQVLIVDPESRLTQLGLLPVGDPESYQLFESRTYGTGEEHTLGELASRWAGETFGDADWITRPFVQLGTQLAGLGRACVARLRGPAPKRVVALSFGVGGNEAKRAGLQFETELSLGLIRDGHALVVDRGIDGDRRASASLLDALLQEGVSIVGADEGNLPALSSGPPIAAQVLTWTGGLGAFSAQVAASDLYIGYDSAFQHIAAAVETPVVAVVLGPPNRVFRQRWRPWSAGVVHVVPEIADLRPLTTDMLVTATIAAARTVLGS